jgi:hypothetical protein
MSQRMHVAWQMTFEVLGSTAVECLANAERLVAQFFRASERAVVIEMNVEPLAYDMAGEAVRWKAECLAMTVERESPK